MEYIKLKDALHVIYLVMSDEGIRRKGKTIRKRLKELPVLDVKSIIERAEEGIKATDSADNYSAGFRNGIRYCLALIIGKDPEYEELKGLKPVEEFPFEVCPKCGRVVSARPKYCGECGNLLDWGDGE